MRACVECGKPTRDRAFVGTHWLCAAHRARLGAPLRRAGGAVARADVLGALVFRFPEACAPAEFVARATYAAETWRARDPARAALRAHRLAGRVGLARGAPVAPSEALAMLAALVGFVARHAPLVRAPALVPLCAARVAEWYPRLVDAAAPRAALLRAESLVRALGPARPFLVLADVAAALGGALDAYLVERVYRAYLARLS
jgi:hypothetical protein